MKPITTILCCNLLFLAGCMSSSPVKIQYYLLDATTISEPNSIEVNQDHASKPLVSLSQIELSEFLRQSSLVLQLGEHQIHNAHNHIWAEPLAEAIPKVLLKDLRKLSQQYNFENGNGALRGQERYKLSLQIDQFHPNDQTQVNLTGRYWIVDMDDKQHSSARDFHFNKTLSEDGYIHSVAQLRSLLTELAHSLIESLQTLSQ
jgi:uncharacterized protein